MQEHHQTPRGNAWMDMLLKIFAWLCKVAAIVFWLWMALVKIELDIANLHGHAGPWGDPDWGMPAFYHRTYLEIATLTALAVLAILPNRWLVFSPVAFTISLLIALIPFTGLSSLNGMGRICYLMTPLMSLVARHAPFRLPHFLSIAAAEMGEGGTR